MAGEASSWPDECSRFNGHGARFLPMGGPRAPQGMRSTGRCIGGDEGRHSVLVRNVVCRFGDKTALGGVELVIAPGEIRAPLGPNGAGKTTLIRVLCGLVKPLQECVLTSGRVGLVPSADRRTADHTAAAPGKPAHRYCASHRRPSWRRIARWRQLQVGQGTERQQNRNGERRRLKSQAPHRIRSRIRAARRISVHVGRVAQWESARFTRERAAGSNPAVAHHHDRDPPTLGQRRRSSIPATLCGWVHMRRLAGSSAAAPIESPTNCGPRS